MLEALGPEAPEASEADQKRYSLLELAKVKLEHVDGKLLDALYENPAAIWSVAVKEAKLYALPDCIWRMLQCAHEDGPLDTKVEDKANRKFFGIPRTWARNRTA